MREWQRQSPEKEAWIRSSFTHAAVDAVYGRTAKKIERRPCLCQYPIVDDNVLFKIRQTRPLTTIFIL